MTIAQTYLQVVQKRFQSVKELGDKTLAQVEEAQLHWAYNEESNSIAVIVKHVSGNMIFAGQIFNDRWRKAYEKSG